MKTHIFRQYDIRGIVREDLDSSVTESVGRALASHVRAETGLDRPRIAVGYDNRTSSPGLAEGMIRGITAAGADVLDIGTVPTPVLAALVECMQEIRAQPAESVRIPVTKRAVLVTCRSRRRAVVTATCVRTIFATVLAPVSQRITRLPVTTVCSAP